MNNDHPHDHLHDQPGAQEAAAARDKKREAALKAHERGQRRKARLAAGLGGAGVVVLLAGAVTAGTLAPPRPPDIDGAAVPAQLKAVPAQGICPGPPRLPAGAGDGTDSEFSPVSTSAESQLTSVLLSDLAGRLPGSTIRTLRAADGGTHDGTPGGESGAQPKDLTEPQPQDVQQGEPATAGRDGVPVRKGSVEAIGSPGGEAGEASVVSVEPIGGQAARAAAVALYSASDGDLAGLDTTSCFAPSHEQWLTGMTTTAGSTAILVLSNPSASASTVDLALYGAEGPVESPGANGIVLAPGQTRSLVLGGMAPDEDHLAVQVSARGGAVGATVQQHRLYGLNPGGVEVIQPTAAPGRTAVMPGFVVPTPEGAAKIVRQNGYGKAGPAVSVAAPGEAATAVVAVYGPDGPVALHDGGKVRIEAGTTVRYPLKGLDAANYTVTVTADAPVVASAQGLTGQAGRPLDLSNVPSVGSLGLERLVARPAGTTSKLVLYSAEGGSVKLTPVFADGSLGNTTGRAVDAESSRTVDLGRLGGGTNGGDSGKKNGKKDVAGVLVGTAKGQVHAGVAVRTDDGISTFPVVPRTEQASGLPVRVGY